MARLKQIMSAGFKGMRPQRISEKCPTGSFGSWNGLSRCDVVVGSPVFLSRHAIKVFGNDLQEIQDDPIVVLMKELGSPMTRILPDSEGSGCANALQVPLRIFSVLLAISALLMIFSSREFVVLLFLHPPEAAE
jgi:hypothetical protein